MEFPDLGSNCAETSCNKLDFLPVKCDGCQKLFCSNHMTYSSHNCPTPRIIDYQVAVCPLCNQPVPSNRSAAPDIAVNAHIERDCQSDPAKQGRKLTTKCSAKGCKNKEVVRITCDACLLNYCVYHRHPIDHKCDDRLSNAIKLSLNENGPVAVDYTAMQGYSTEEEALSYAIAITALQAKARAGNIPKIKESPTHTSTHTCNIS